jgi:hypothetical protein
MSTDTIKSIKIDIKNKKVFITSSSNNVYPRYYSCQHHPYYDQFFDKEGGIDEIKKDILFSFFSREFQGLSTNYGKAVASFKYGGDRHEIWKKCDDKEFRINFQNQLLNHFNQYEAKRKCKKVFNVKLTDDRWIVKLNTNSAITCADQNRAKKFNQAIAEEALKRFAMHGAKMVEVEI